MGNQFHFSEMLSSVYAIKEIGEKGRKSWKTDSPVLQKLNKELDYGK